MTTTRKYNSLKIITGEAFRFSKVFGIIWLRERGHVISHKGRHDWLRGFCLLLRRNYLLNSVTWSRQENVVVIFQTTIDIRFFFISLSKNWLKWLHQDYKENSQSHNFGLFFQANVSFTRQGCTLTILMACSPFILSWTGIRIATYRFEIWYF